jgi:hypothetical protein
MTHVRELSFIWSQLTQCFQLMNSTTSKAEKLRLKSLSEMLRIEYRNLTSRYGYKKHADT